MIQGPSLWGLIPLIVFIVLVFKKWNPVAAIATSIIVGAIMSGQTAMTLAASIQGGMGSFLAYVGLIIMAGGGLGKVTEKTGVAKKIVHFVMNRIGVDSPNRAIIGTMAASTLLVALLGTLAGANALIAPVIIPIVAAAGLSSSVVAVIFQGAGATGLFLGPFTPPMVTLMELTGLSYFQVVLYAGLPISILLWIATFVYSKKILPKSLKENAYLDEDMMFEEEEYKDEKEKAHKDKVSKQATIAFLVTLISLLVYGIIVEGGSTFAIFIILTTAVITGLVGRLSPSQIADTFAEGARPLVWLFFQFVLFTPFMEFIEEMGAFEALANILLPYIETGGAGLLAILATVIGVVGVPGAAVAQSIVLNEMFAPMVIQTAIPMSLWVVVLLIGSQITSFLFPTGDTLAAMGIARSKDIKNMVIFGVVATIPPILFVVVRALFL